LGNLTVSMSEPGPPEPAPEPAPRARRIPRRYLALGLIIVAICVLGVLVLVRDDSGPPSSPTTETFTPAPSSLITAVASVPASVFDTVGVSSPDIPVTAPHEVGTGRQAPWKASDGDSPARPVVFFYGAEFAPYPAAERWPLVLALSRFGTFKKLGLMQSSMTTAFADLSTYTFWQSSYSSPYVTFQPVERYSSLNATGARYLGLERPTAKEAGAITLFGEGSTTFALLDVANRYVLTGAAFTPGALTGLTQNQIAGYLTTPASPLTQAVVASANEISASICAVDGQEPGAVCHSHGVLAAAAVMGITPGR